MAKATLYKSLVAAFAVVNAITFADSTIIAHTVHSGPHAPKVSLDQVGMHAGMTPLMNMYQWTAKDLDSRSLTARAPLSYIAAASGAVLPPVADGAVGLVVSVLGAPGSVVGHWTGVATGKTFASATDVKTQADKALAERFKPQMNRFPNL
ncbi:hypothetical protein [Micavibrio aeruginosavorus]|uniref:hypothetical protein n=1 Tax=Micavibrio aeruginosavorus TaxID=349221 RepID=UPI003F4AAD62